MTQKRMSSNASLASILVRIFGPAIYDAPPFNGGDPFHLSRVFGPHPEPWRSHIAGVADYVALNPQPLPPKVVIAIRLADAHLAQVFELDRMAQFMGAKVLEGGIQSLSGTLADVDEICPKWPKWPFPWPPPRDDFGDDVMRPDELLVFGSQFLAASSLIANPELAAATASIGNKAMDLALAG